MEYVINNYSLHGQFPNKEAFWESLHNYTMPVMNRILKDNDFIIWKANTLWSKYTYDNKTLYDALLEKTKNVGYPEIPSYKSKLLKLLQAHPFLEEDYDNNVRIVKYLFDEEIIPEEKDCFSIAIHREAPVVSFEDEIFKKDKLEVELTVEGKRLYCDIKNIYSIDCWTTVTRVKNYRINDVYVVQVRANEFEFHPPHFHFCYGNRKSPGYKEAMIKILNCEFYQNESRFSASEKRLIKDFYNNNREELIQSWNELHPYALVVC